MNRVANGLLIGLLWGALFLINIWDFLTYSSILCLTFLFVTCSFLRKKGVICSAGAIAAHAVPATLVTATLIFTHISTSPPSQALNWGWLRSNEFNSVGSLLRMFGFWFLLLFGSIFFSLKSLKVTPSLTRVILAGAVASLPFFLPLFKMAVLFLGHTFPAIGQLVEVPADTNVPIGTLLLSSALLFSSILIARFNGWLGILIASTAAIILGVETIFIIDHMNTVFKFYNAVWVLLVLAAITGLSLWIESAPSKVRSNYLPKLTLLTPTVLALIAGAIACCCVITFQRVVSPRPTLDGELYIENHLPLDAPLIHGINATITGTPTVIEAVGESYGDFGRIAMHTGLPSFLGWEHHVFQRGLSRQEIARRQGIIQQIFTSTDAKAAYRQLRRENISIIVVGKLEYQRYGHGGMRKFAENPQFYKPLVLSKDYGVFIRR